MAENKAPSQDVSGPSIAVMVAVFATATSVLAFEIALTRAFSVLLRYHFVFLAISLATCGLGIGGLIDFLLYRRFPHWHVPTQLAIRGLITGALYPLTVFLLFSTPLAAKLTSVWVVSAICICPFLAAGLLLSRAFAEFSAASGKLYFADLAGAAIGSFAVIAVLQLVGAINAAFVCGLLVAVGAAGLALSITRPLLLAAWELFMGAFVLLITVHAALHIVGAINVLYTAAVVGATVAAAAACKSMRKPFLAGTFLVVVATIELLLVADALARLVTAGSAATNAALICGLPFGVIVIALLFCAKRPLLTASSVMVIGMLALLLAVNINTRYLDLPLMPLSHDPLAKPLYQELADPRAHAKIVASEWNAFARTDVVAYGNDKGEFDPEDDLYVYTDGEVPTNMMAFDGDLGALERRLRRFIGFVPFEQFRPESVMLIGPGGGLDILLALAVDSKEIVGAELNPSIPRLVRRYGDFTGHIYDYENVHIYVDEARSFLQRSDREFDLIYMALAKTATTASSSLALVESYIHTKEAFVDCLQHLTPDGKIGFVCQEPLILMRTMLTAREALAEVGVPYEQSMQHFLAASMPLQAYVLGPYRHLLVISRSAITPEVAEQFAKHAIALHFDPAYAPGAYMPAPFTHLVDDPAMPAAQFVEWFNQERVAYGYSAVNIIPCSDDNPFVIDLTFGIPAQFTWFVVGAFGVGVVISLVLLVMAVRDRRCEASAGELSAAIVYFMLLGIGFMLVEISLIQKLVLYLGYPVLSLSTLLFAILISGALGSLFTQRWPAEKLAKVVMVAAAGIVVYGLASQYLYPTIVDATLAYDIRWRCLITMVMLFPLGFCLGMPFPSGIRVVGGWGQNLVPWLWGINGLTSVVGSVAAMSLAKLWGFSNVQIVGWALYVGVFILATAQYYAKRPSATTPEKTQ